MSEDDDQIVQYLRRRADRAEPRPNLADVKAGRMSTHSGTAETAAPSRRRPAWFAAVAVGLALLVGGVTVALWPDDGPDTSAGPVDSDPSPTTTASIPESAPEAGDSERPWVVGRGDFPTDMSPFSLDSPDVVWEVPLVSGEAGSARVSAIATANDDVVVAGTGDGRVVALDPANGAQRWSVDLTAGSIALEDYNSYAMYPALGGDSVYVAASTGVVYALDVATGEVRWSNDLGGLFGGYPVVVDGTVVVSRSWWDIYDDRVDYAGPGPVDNGGVVGVDADTGAVLWELDFDLQSFVAAGPPGTVIVSSFDTRFVGNGSLQLLDAATGETRWQVDGLDGDAPPTYANGVVVVAASNVVAFDLDGQEIWRTAADWFGSFHFPVAVGDTLALVTNGAALYGLGLQTGRTCWGYSIGDNYAISYPGPPGVAAFATGPGAVWIDTRSGEPAGFLPADDMPLSVTSIGGGEVVAGLDGVVRLVGPIPEADITERDGPCEGPAAIEGDPTEPAQWPLAVLGLLDSEENPGWKLRQARYAVDGSFAGRHSDSVRWALEYERVGDPEAGVNSSAPLMLEGHSVGIDGLRALADGFEVTDVEPIGGRPTALLVHPLDQYIAAIAISVGTDFTLVIDSRSFTAEELLPMATQVREVDAAGWLEHRAQTTPRSVTPAPAEVATTTTTSIP